MKGNLDSKNTNEENQQLNSNKSGGKPVSRHIAIKISVIYFFVSLAWILATDSLEYRFLSGTDSMAFVSIGKGIFFICITSLLLYCLISTFIKKMLYSDQKMEQINTNMKKSNLLYDELHQEFDRKQALLEILLNSIPDLIFYKNNDSIYLGCNKAFEQFVGKSEDEIIGLTDFDLFPKKEAIRSRNVDMKIIVNHTHEATELPVIYPDGKKACLEILKSPYYDAKGNTVGIIGISRDITERKIEAEKIQYLNYHDSLTGIYNRAYFQKARKQFDNTEHLPLSVIMGDVNGLKLINDAFGHMAGDELLTEVADILKQCCRQRDIVARIGGDEFAILMPHTDLQTANSIADQIRSICRLRSSQADFIHTHIAVGYATKTHCSESFDTTMALAEDFMYRRKLLETQSLRNSILSSIKTTLFEKSNETEEHAERLAELSRKLGEAIGLPDEKMDELELVATLHDIGKISVDKNVLTKEELLSDEDWREIKRHPEVGYRIANSSPELRHIANYILCHHERWDGNGYPQGLSGDKIPLISRIVSIIDSFDAMTQDRSYRKALPRDHAIHELINNSGTQFDPFLVKTFIEKVANA